MGDRKENDLGREEDVEATLPTAGDGLRRSRRVRKLPPLPPPQSEAGEVVASTRKRGRLQEAVDPTKEEGRHDGGDHVKVMKGVKVGSPAKATSLVSGVGMEGGEEEAGKMSLPHQQPIHVEKGMATQSKKKVGRGVVQLGGKSSSSSVIMSSAAGRSEDGSLPFQQSAGEEEAHPLLIETVLEVMFKHVIERPGGPNYDRRVARAISKDVQSCRLVCKAWKDSATRVYRRNRRAKHFDYNDSRKTLTAFMHVMRSSEMIPVQKFNFRGSDFDDQENLKMFRDFLLICGPDVVSLDLFIESSAGERIMPNLGNLPHLNMLKLRALKLYMSEDHESEVKLEPNRVHGIVSLLQLLLNAAQELRELELSYWKPCGSAYRSGQLIIMDQMIGSIIASRTLKQLKLVMEINESTFNNLAGVGLKLERLDFGVPSVLGCRTPYEFLQSQAATLTDFRLWNGTPRERIFLEFPRLDELVKLELGDVTINTTAGSDFLKTFPKLRCLDIRGMGTDDAFGLLLSSVKRPSQSLKVIHLPKLHYTSLIKGVAKAFPCIAELSILLYHSSRDTLVEIFKYLDNLESLQVSFYQELGLTGTTMSSYWADSLFSGISELDCARIRGSQGVENVDLNHFQRQPSILYLTKLRKLSVSSGNMVVGFTDLAARFVFLEMESLREIYLSSCTTHPALVTINIFISCLDDFWCFSKQFSRRYIDLLRKKLVARGSPFDNLI